MNEKFHFTGIRYVIYFSFPYKSIYVGVCIYYPFLNYFYITDLDLALFFAIIIIVLFAGYMAYFWRKPADMDAKGEWSLVYIVTPATIKIYGKANSINFNIGFII